MSQQDLHWRAGAVINGDELGSDHDQARAAESPNEGQARKDRTLTVRRIWRIGTGCAVLLAAAVWLANVGVAAKAPSTDSAPSRPVRARVGDREIVVTVDLANAGQSAVTIAADWTLSAVDAMQPWEDRAYEGGTQQYLVAPGTIVTATWREPIDLPSGSYKLTAWTRSGSSESTEFDYGMVTVGHNPNVLIRAEPAPTRGVTKVDQIRVNGAAALSVTWSRSETVDGARRLVVDRVPAIVPFTHRWRIVEPTSTPAEMSVNADAASSPEMTTSIEVPLSDAASWVRVRLFNDAGESVDQVLLLEVG